MEFKPLEITAIHATDLKNVNLFSKMAVYVIVRNSADPRSVNRTYVDKIGHTNPSWTNLGLKFTIEEHNPQTLVFTLRSARFLGDRDIGEVHVPVKDLLDTASAEKSKSVTYQIRRRSGRPFGTLNFSYKIGETFTSHPQIPNPSFASGPKMGYTGEPVVAYPPTSQYPPQGGAYYAQPPQYPPQGGGYYPPQQYPPPHGYAPQQQPGYGYPGAAGYGYPAAPVKKKNNKMGLGLGVGAGLLGGLLVGDMISDAGDMASYDAGYDDALGGGDGGGFDF